MSERPTSGPAPRWGEYAPTPETPPVPENVEEQASAVAAARVAPQQDEPTTPPETPARRERAWDRALTIGLLAFGGFNVLLSIPQFVDFAGLLRTAYSTAGYGTYTSDALASALGAVAIVVQAVLLVLAVVIAGRLLRSGRIAFWVPLTAGALAAVVVLVVTVVAMLGDPALPAWIDGQVVPSPASSVSS